MPKDFEVVIVGAGHNGLTAGCYLARAGRRVLVVERSATVGGMTSAGFLIPEAPRHLVTPGAIECIHLRKTGIVEELGLGRHGFRVVEPDPSYAYLDPDGSSIALFRDPRRTAEDIGRLSRGDGRAYLKFMELIDALLDIGSAMTNSDPGRPRPGDLFKLITALVRHRRLRRELTNLASGTADQIACEWFEHPATIGYLINIAGGAGPIDQDGSAAALMLIGLLHRVGVGKPIGSLQSLANALAAAFKEHGGQIQLNAPVAEILIEHGTTRGVRLADGRFITADVVIATCDPRTAYRLTTPGGIERRLMVRMEHAPAGRNNVAPMLANIALSGPLRLRRHQDSRHDDADLNKAVGLIGTPEEVRKSFTAAIRGDLPERHAVSVSPISNWDPSQAPTGQSIAYVYLPGVAVEMRGGWDAARERAMASILAQVGEFYEGFEHEIGRFVETPPDRAKRLNLTNGCVTHIDFAASRMGLKRPAYGLGGPKPVVPGFFLGGAGIHPPGGVTGVPGRTAAERVARYLKQTGNV
jgi:phytoene dehydrogenase-like protein